MRKNKKAKKNEFTKEEKNILDHLTDEHKKKYLIKSNFVFISLYISLLFISLWLFFIDVYQVFIMKEYRYQRYRFCSAFCIVFVIYFLIKYLKKSKDEKIVDYYKILNNENITNKKIRLIFWFIEILIILTAIVLPIYHIIFSNGNMIVLILISISGLIFSVFLWFVALRRKKKIGDNQNDNIEKEQ